MDIVYTIITAPTEALVKAKAQKIIASTDKSKQPSVYACYPHISGEWRLTIRTIKGESK